jgi:hypothetical protein
MKTFVPALQKLRQSIIALIVLTFAGLASHAQSSNGLIFENPVHQSGTALQVGAKYLFPDVGNNADAVITIDSLINGAKVETIDDNGNGVGYKHAFQPRIQSGNIIGMSYVVFTVQFFEKGTTTPKTMQTVNATAVDLDGNSTLKEIATINMGTGSTVNYMSATPDISVAAILPGVFHGQNVLGIERSGIDTSAMANMFTANNSNISSFSIRYGTITTSPSAVVRQFSLYMKGFNYPGSTLPVKLASFTATLTTSNKADLKWTTASELNVSHFVIERSVDGNSFTEAGLIFAMGNSADNVHYSFSDNLAGIASQVVWYRLRSVDMDGKTEFSETRMIRISRVKENSVSILTYPNPVVNELRITIPATWQNRAVNYQVYSIGGQMVHSKQTAASSQTETIDLTKMGSGIYIIKAVCGSESAQQRIVKH